MDKTMQNRLHEIRQELMQQIETSHETPQAKAALKAMFANMTDEEFMQIAYPGYRDDKHETVGELPIEFSHPFTKRSPIKMEKGADIAIEHIDAATIHVVRKVYPDSYFNVYFIRDAKDSFKAVCYYGDILNELFGKDVRGSKTAHVIPESAKKSYPYTTSIIQNLKQFGDSYTKPYLNTIGFNHQPRQWFLVVNITDIEEFVHLSMYGPDSKALNAAINYLFRDSLLLYYELTVGGTLEYALRVAQFFNGSATSKIFTKGK